MEKISCVIEVLTPMFLGGAPQEINKKPICELRAQSIKGVIRYWYRALVGPDRLKEEAELFGSSDEKIGVSKIKIIISNRSDVTIKKVEALQGYSFPYLKQYEIKDTVTTPKGRQNITINPLYYLAYGPAEYYKAERGLKISRSYIQQDSQFTLKFILYNCNSAHTKDFYKSLYLMFNFGGLGSRSRKGYGAIKLLNEDDIFNGHDWFIKGDITNTLKNIINNKSPIKPMYSKEYSYLDTGTRFWLSKETSNKWEECLSMLGKHYRGWRQVLPVADGRENLGTPLLHGKNGIKDQRRASSYFLTVFKLNGNEYKYGVLHIPSNYSDKRMILFNVQQEHHAKFQEEIEKTATKEV